MQPHRIFYNLIFFPLLFSVSSCKNNKDDKKGAPPRSFQSSNTKVEVYIVNPKQLNQDIEAPGNILPFEESELHPEIAGRVTGIYFKEGSNVAKGTLLVKLYDADQQAQVQKLKVQLKIAEKTEQRQSELLKIGGISQQDYDLSLLTVNNLQADINITNTNIEKTEIRAPFNGQTGLRNISIGAYVTPQTIISTIRENNRLKLEFTIPERYGSRLQSGSLVNFTVEGDPKIYSAKVIASENSITENTRTMRVRGVVDKVNNKLIAGAFAKVKVPLGENLTALMIPTQAVIPQSRDKKVIAVRNGMASFETVVTGTRDSAMVEITSGLKEGDTVLTTGLLTTRPGAKVLLSRK